MGSMIHLRLGKFEVDWGKNGSGSNHGPLFQPTDVRKIRYEYVREDGAPLFRKRNGASRILRKVLPRLELLGFTVEGARAEFDAVSRLDRDGPGFSFEVLHQALKDLDVDKAAADYHTDFDWGELFERAVAPLLFGIGATPDEFGCFGVGWIMENFSPWAVLRLLADNPANLRRPVEWAFADVVEGGWVEEEDIIASLRAPRKFLIVTEGSSDSMVLRKALQLLRPEVEDFFSFVDMERGYPFTGSGNMVKFCQGLVNIGIENQIIAVFDNDAEGVAGQAALRRLNLPINLRATCLPDLDELREMDTSGPQGHSRTDINGRAASIECYLDFASVGSHPPRVRWSSFNATAGVYQGELEDKQSYVRQFLSATVDSLRSGYDCSKLGAALDSIIRECVGIAEAQKCSAGGR